MSTTAKVTKLQDIYIDGLYRHGAKHGNAEDRRVYEALVRKGLVKANRYGDHAGAVSYSLTKEGRDWHEGRFARIVAAALATKS